MATIINSKDLGISKEQMKELYTKNLILCDDYDLIIAIIPNWTMNEVMSVLKCEIDGTEIDDKDYIPANKIDMMLNNHYHYPKLYDLICGT